MNPLLFGILVLSFSFVSAQPSNCVGTYTKYNFTYTVSQQATIHPSHLDNFVGDCEIQNANYSTLTSSIAANDFFVLISGSYIDSLNRKIVREHVLYTNGSLVATVFCGCVFGQGAPYQDCCDKEFASKNEEITGYLNLDLSTPRSIAFNQMYCFETQSSGTDTCLCLGEANITSFQEPCPTPSPAPTATSKQSSTTSTSPSTSSALVHASTKYFWGIFALVVIFFVLL